MAIQSIRCALPEAALSLTAQVSTVAGVPFATDVSVTEVGQGLYTLPLTNSSGQYRLTLTDNDDSDAIIAVLYATTTNTAATFDSVSERVLLDIAADAATAAAGSGGGGGGGGEVTGFTSTAISQLAGTTLRLATNEQVENRSLDIVQGCDYAAADETALTWSLSDTAVLTGATATLTLKKGTTTQTFTGTVTEMATNTWEIAIELTAVQTAALTASSTDWTYSLSITLANSHVRSLRAPGHRARVLSPT